MRKKISSILIIIFLFNTNLFSQKRYIVIDSIYNTPISFATIKNVKTNEGIVCDEFGRFTISELGKETIEIRCLGYKTKFIQIEKINDTILLKAIPFELEEINITKNTNSTREFGLKGNKINWYFSSDSQFGTLLTPSEDLVNSRIKKIKIPIQKKIHYKKIDSIIPNNKFKSIIKIHLFSNKNNLPDKSLLEKPISININEKTLKYIQIDISEYSINFPKEGIFICIEIVGEIDDNGDVKKILNHRPALVFTDKIIDEFQSESYIKSKFDDQWIKIDHRKIQLKKNIFIALSLILEMDEK